MYNINVMIRPELLFDFGAEKMSVAKGEEIFCEGRHSNCYFQILEGEVKMFNINEDGKEFIQGIFYPGQSFGEPPLFVDVQYPASAEALMDSEIIRLNRDRFFDLLTSHPEEHLKITTAMASRLYYKSIMASELSSQEPEHRILSILDYLKKHVYQLHKPFSFEVDLTRQQIADLTGLRVETVIRATKALEKKGEVKIINRKIWR